MDLKRLFWKSATNKKRRDGIENSIAQKHYDKPRKARKMEAVASTFLRVLSPLGRGIFMPSLRFLFKYTFSRSLFKSMPAGNDVADDFH